MNKFIALLALSVTAAWSAAQESFPGPPAELDKLNWILGEWTGTFEWFLPGMESKSPMSYKTEREGNFIKTSSLIDMDELKFTETAFIGWDPQKKRYSSWTFTNYAPTPRIEYSMGIDDTSVVFESEPWEVGMPGGPTVSRSTMRQKGENELHLLLEFKMGDTWAKAAEGVFKKK